MKIKNKILFIMKHIGIGLLLIGLILVALQFKIPNVYPSSIIILIIAFVLQVISLKEPYWLFVDKK